MERMKTVEMTCKCCGWVGIIVNSEEDKDNGWRCFRCGNTDKTKFRPTLEADCPRGVTIQQINVVRPVENKEP